MINVNLFQRFPVFKKEKKKQFINMLIIMYMYFNLDLLFHLETSKNNKWNINQIFIKHWLLFFFFLQLLKPFSKYTRLTIIIQIKLLLTTVKLPVGLMLFSHYYVLLLKRQVFVNQEKQLFLLIVFRPIVSTCLHKTEKILLSNTNLWKLNMVHSQNSMLILSNIACDIWL